MNNWKQNFILAIITGYIIGFFNHVKTPTPPPSCAPAHVNKSKLKLNLNQGFIYVGVMTTIEYLLTRGIELWESWGKNFAGSIEFYVGGRNLTKQNRQILNDIGIKLPLHILQNVDDLAYPPQKKSFYMINNMIRTKMEKHKWFLRSDDDLFVNTEKLDAFLRRVNESAIHLIGSPGEGNTLDQLEKNQMYCMGGPGIILSQSLLRRLDGKLTKCLSNLKTNHEDVELSRCIKSIAGATCGRSLEANLLFAEDYDKRKIKRLPVSNSMSRARNALAIHPNKGTGEQSWRVKMQLSNQIRSLLLKISSISEQSTSTKISNVTWTNHERKISGTNLGKTYLPHASKMRTKLDYKSYLKILESEAKDRIDEQQESTSGMKLAWDAMKLEFQSFRQIYHVVEPMVGLFINIESSYKLDRAASFDPVALKKVPDSSVPTEVTSRLLHRFSAPVQLSTKYADTCHLNFVLSVSGRLSQLERFSRNLAHMSDQCSFHVAISVYETAESNIGLVTTSLDAWLGTRITHSVIKAQGSFSRSAGLNAAFELIKDDNATLITDVDMVFDMNFVTRCQRYVLQRHRVYFPIVLSEFNPSYHSSVKGYWREFGYGMVCIHPSDYRNIGKLSESYKEWGEEDCDFVSRAAKSGYEVFRANDAGIRHIWHESVCPTIENSKKRDMCYRTAYGNYASLYTLAQIYATGH